MLPAFLTSPQLLDVMAKWAAGKLVKEDRR
jgi:hypothetical protein